MKLLTTRLPRHSWSELAARRPPGEPDAALGRARAITALQCKTLYHSSEIAEISEISPSSPRPPELSFENWEASDGKNESSRRVLSKSGEFLGREVEVTRAEAQTSWWILRIFSFERCARPYISAQRPRRNSGLIICREAAQLGNQRNLQCFHLAESEGSGGFERLSCRSGAQKGCRNVQRMRWNHFWGNDNFKFGKISEQKFRPKTLYPFCDQKSA